MGTFFNDKEDTNIDKDFKGNKKPIRKIFLKLLPFIIGIVVFIIILIVFSLFNKKQKEYHLSLYGSNNITTYLGEEFIDPGFIAYDEDNNSLVNEVVVTGLVDVNTIGVYKLTYTLGDLVIYRNVTVSNKEAGNVIISLVGDNVINIKLNEEFVDPGYVAIDSIDGDISNLVSVNGEIDNKKEGTYKISYSVTNSSGITNTKERFVVVKK